MELISSIPTRRFESAPEIFLNPAETLGIDLYRAPQLKVFLNDLGMVPESRSNRKLSIVHYGVTGAMR